MSPGVRVSCLGLRVILTKARQRHHKKRHYRQISLTNIDAEIVNKILADLIHQYIKGLYTMSKWDLSEECRGGSAYENQLIIYHINIIKGENTSFQKVQDRHLTKSNTFSRQKH